MTEQSSQGFVPPLTNEQYEAETKDPQDYRDEENDSEPTSKSEQQMPPLHKAPTNLFSPSVRHLHRILWTKTVITLVIMCTLILCMLSVYWGAMFHRNQRAHNLNIWVLNYDDGPDSFVGPSLTSYLEPLGKVNTNLGYQIKDPASYEGNLTTIEDDTVKEVAWGIIAIAPNASSYLLSQLESPSADFDPSYLVTFHCSQARSETTFATYIFPQMTAVQEQWTAMFRDRWLAMVRNQTTAEQRSEIFETNPDIFANPIRITTLNYRPFFNEISSAVLSVGLIFLIIVSFFQIPFFVPLHMIFIGKIKFPQYMLLRPFLNYFSVLILSLGFSLVSLAFQADFNLKYGRAGFVIYWMINYMAMLALGGASENVGAVIMTVFPPAMGFWLIFWVCLNSATAMFPLELSPAIYRVGRALPVHNAQMAIRTVLFNTNNQLGMNFGIFAAWLVVNYILSFPALAFVKWYKTREARKAAAAAGNQPGGP